MYAALPDTPMPNVVYINGFGLKEPEKELEERVRELENQAFYDECRVVVLHEGNCDLTDNELAAAAFRAGNWEFAKTPTPTAFLAAWQATKWSRASWTLTGRDFIPNRIIRSGTASGTSLSPNTGSSWTSIRRYLSIRRSYSRPA